ncbi:hypothetical protein GBAR_LOCUS18059, partial [Geodia barretti]
MYLTFSEALSISLTLVTEQKRCWESNKYSENGKSHQSIWHVFLAKVFDTWIVVEAI